MDMSNRKPPANESRQGHRTFPRRRGIFHGSRGKFHAAPLNSSSIFMRTRWPSRCATGSVDSPRVSAGTFALDPDGAAQLRLLNEITQSITLGESVEGVFNLVYDRLRD